MGISGLIPFLEKASTKIFLKDISGSTVAVDTYCWLHKGVFTCAEKLARGEETDLYIQYCMKYVQMLLSYDIKPILVFDGQHLPAKALTERRRRESREQSKKRAKELLRLGRHDEARSHMRRCIDVTHEMALKLIRECRMRNVDCIVAPYEADAQMAWLNKVEIAQYVVTEDSDLALFGAKKIIFKLDLTASGLLVESSKFHLAMNCREEKYSFDKFRRMCILSGCDYLDSLPGIGLTKACRFVLKVEPEMDFGRALKRIPEYLNMRSLEVNEKYIENFFKAEATFKHMYIFNALERRIERLNSLSEYGTEISHCCNAGILMENNEQAFNLALGNLNPFTLKELDKWHPDNAVMLTEIQSCRVKRSKHKSIWQSDFVSHSSRETQLNEKCAIIFKTVDFVSKTLDAEIEENNRTEHAKPNEADIFCMYTSTKRRRHVSSSDSESEKGGALPSSPRKTKASHNPFAVSKESSQLQSSPVVCETTSLLRLLSPKKCKAVAEPQENQLELEKHAICTEKKQTSTTVRSRFFIGTSKEASKRPANKIDKDLMSKIEIIESTAATFKRLQSQLYSPPTPPRKRISIQNLSTTYICSKDEVQDERKEINEEQKVGKFVDNDSIFISDDSNEPQLFSSSQSTSTSSSSQNNLNLPPINQFETKMQPRLGLSKHKSAAKANKTSTKTAKVGENQTRLSMFGFQKRPILK